MEKLENNFKIFVKKGKKKKERWKERFDISHKKKIKDKKVSICIFVYYAK